MTAPGSRWAAGLAFALLLLAGTAATAATFVPTVDPSWWVADVASHVKPQLAVVLSGVMAGLLLLGRLGSAALFGFVLVANLVIVAPVLIPGPGASPVGEPVRIGLVNVGADNARTDLVTALLEKTEPDIVIFLEFTTRWGEELRIPLSRFEGRAVARWSGPRGMALFSRTPPRSSRVVRLVDGGGPSILAEFVLGSKRFEVLAVHFPSPFGEDDVGRRDRELEALAEFVDARPVPVVVVGELNTAYWSRPFRALIDATGLTPAAMGNGLRRTWPTDGSLIGLTLDQVLVPPEMVWDDYERGASVGSDHFPLRVEVAWAG